MSCANEDAELQWTMETFQSSSHRYPFLTCSWLNPRKGLLSWNIRLSLNHLLRSRNRVKNQEAPLKPTQRLEQGEEQLWKGSSLDLAHESITVSRAAPHFLSICVHDTFLFLLPGEQLNFVSRGYHSKDILPNECEEQPAEVKASSGAAPSRTAGRLCY